MGAPRAWSQKQQTVGYVSQIWRPWNLVSPTVALRASVLAQMGQVLGCSWPHAGQPLKGLFPLSSDLCQNVKCLPQETCQEKDGQAVCVPNYEARCWLLSDPHYHTFDGWNTDFQGTCKYVLATTNCLGVNNTWGLTPFTITTKNENWGSPAVSFVRLVTVTTLNINISIHKGEVGKVRVSATGWSPESLVVGRGAASHSQELSVLSLHLGLKQNGNKTTTITAKTSALCWEL